MVADALQFQVAAIQGEALVLVETDGADAERRRVSIHGQIVLEHLGHQRVEVGMVDVPALRLRHGQKGWDGERSRPRGIGWNRHVHEGAAHHDAVGAEHRRLHRGLDLFAGTVAQRGFHRHRSLVIAHLGRCDIGAPMGNIHGPGNVEPHVAIDARARIPARRVILGREPHSNEVGNAVEIQVRREVQAEAYVAVRTPAQLMPVQPHLRIGHSAVELDAEVFSLSAGRKRERLAIPAGAEDGQRAGVRVELRIERTFDRPIVGQPDGAPRGIVELWSFGARSFTFVEPPAIVEAEPALTGKRNRRGGRVHLRQQSQKCHRPTGGADMASVVTHRMSSEA